MIQKVKVVLGALFGDEGKGNTVQWLCQKALENNEEPIVVRFSGGPQAGHRVVHNNVEHVCSLIGSGVLLNVPTYLGPDVYIDPISLKNEIQCLIDKGINPKIDIDNACRIITPMDREVDCNDTKVKEHGSCGCGIHATFMRYKKYESPPSAAGAIAYPKAYLKWIGSDQNKDYIEACEWLCDHVHFTSYNTLSKYTTVIFEGSQGLLLDMENGFMPHCTPSKVGLNGVPRQYLDDAEVYLVIRSYLTRHGNGYEPECEKVIRSNYINLEEPTNLDNGPQGKFKIGVHNLTLLRDAFVRHHLDNYARMYGVKFNLVITHMDCCGTIAVIRRSRNWPTSVQPWELKFDIIDFQNIYLGYSPDSLFKKVDMTYLS